MKKLTKGFIYELKEVLVNKPQTFRRRVLYLGVSEERHRFQVLEFLWPDDGVWRAPQEAKALTGHAMKSRASMETESLSWILDRTVAPRKPIDAPPASQPPRTEKQPSETALSGTDVTTFAHEAKALIDEKLAAGRIPSHLRMTTLGTIVDYSERFLIDPKWPIPTWFKDIAHDVLARRDEKKKVLRMPIKLRLADGRWLTFADGISAEGLIRAILAGMTETDILDLVRRAKSS